MRPGRSVGKPVEQPARPDDVGARRPDAPAELAVGADDDGVFAVLRGERGDRVVAGPGCVDDLDAVTRAARRGAGPGLPLEDEDDGRLEVPLFGRAADARDEPARRARPIAPPTRRTRPDHVGDVDDEHPMSVAHERCQTAPDRTQDCESEFRGPSSCFGG